MSFSGIVKNELVKQTGKAYHCRYAEMAAILTMCGGVTISARDRCRVFFHTENRYVAEKCEALLQNAFGIRPEVRIRLYARSRIYLIAVTEHEQAVSLLEKCHLLRRFDEILFPTDIGEEPLLAKNSLLHRECCRRAFFRGAFLTAGSISDPRKFYHLEIVCQSLDKAKQLQQITEGFGLDAKIVARKNSFVFYLKEGTQIVDALGIMEAPKALMEMENIRILREISNDVNRRVNCETANISKTVSAALRQIRDISYILEHGGLSALSPPLQQIAHLRLEHEDLPLQELGKLMDPPIGKSGVNHRLEKISAIAGAMRKAEEGK